MAYKKTVTMNRFGELDSSVFDSFTVRDRQRECKAPAIDLTTKVDSDKTVKPKATEPSKNRAKKKKKKEEKSEEVIHVRAKRGQATDTHSLAERVRREKINSKFRCLQDLVPGCQKTMGLIAMLDEIISYVHSLKNQVEFLSMELESACSHQLSRNKIATRTEQETGSHEAEEIEKWVREQYFQTT